MKDNGTYPQDFSLGPWKLRDGRVVGGLRKDDHNEEHWVEPATMLVWDLEGNSITPGNSMTDIIEKATAAGKIPVALDFRRKVYVVTGGSSGLGLAICRRLIESEDKPEVFNFDMKFSELDKFSGHHSFGGDLRYHEDISIFARAVPSRVDALINCAGANCIEWIDSLCEADWNSVMNINARAIFLLSQALLANLRSDGTIVNIVSNASHVPMTNSLVYNASKAAAHMMTLQMARELSKTHGITVFGISPNKLKGTAMSRYIEGRVPDLRDWTPEQAEAYQKQALLSGEETDPEMVAELLVFLLSKKERHKYLGGCIIPYGA